MAGVQVCSGEIARLSYKTSPKHVNQLYYNNLVVGTWEEHVPQRFVVRVNLNTKKTSLWFGPLDATPAPGTPTIPFVDAGANLTEIVLDLIGKENGKMGWSEISATRLPDA